MHIVNIRGAKTHLSKLVDLAANGEPFIIAKAGVPLVRVSAIDTPISAVIRRIGFLQDQFLVPDDFNEMGASEISQLFEE